jgi:hypothetical protein
MMEGPAGEDDLVDMDSPVCFAELKFPASGDVY